MLIKYSLAHLKPNFTLPRWLLWCLPGLIVALILRLLLMSEWPGALFWSDSDDSLDTVEKWFVMDQWKIHTKKTWLSPTVYTLLGYLPGGLLWLIPWVQHFLGLLCVVFAGGVCRVWFQHWKVWILPVTMLMAIHPGLISWEHTIMQESWFFTALLWMAWRTGAYVSEPSRRRLAWLLLVAILLSASRPEGKLMFAAVPLAVGIVTWGKWRFFGISMAVVLLTGLLISRTTKTGQSGLLLLTSVVKYTPDELKGYPGLAERLKEVGNPFVNPSEMRYAFPSAKIRREVSSAVHGWLKDQKLIIDGKDKVKVKVDEMCKKIAIQICLEKPFQIFHWMGQKFRKVSALSTAFNWDQNHLIDKQIEAYMGGSSTAGNLGPILFGKSSMPKEGEIEEWIKRHYHVPSPDHWFVRWENAWANATLLWRTPTFMEAPKGQPLPGVPWLKVFAFGGMLLGVLGLSKRHQSHWAFTPVFFGLILAVVLASNIKPRFLAFIEPFWILYLVVVLDQLVSLGRLVLQRVRSKG